MIQWIIDNSDEKNRDDVAYVTKTQMFISVVAIHTTTMTVGVKGIPWLGFKY